MLFKNKTEIIAIDHGYGNVKTAHSYFRTGVTAYEKEPVFKNNLLEYEGKYYTIGEGHKEFLPRKQNDGDFYLFTLVAVAMELEERGLTEAKVYLAAGLPLTWVSEQKEQFKAYLLQNDHVDFRFRGVNYSVDFVGADIFPQGFSAVADRLHEFKGTNLLCDIGNGTMNVMFINNQKPDGTKCFTEKFGTNQCMLTVKEALMRKYNIPVDESLIEEVFRTGKADIADRFLFTITQTARKYVDGIFRSLREHEYHPDLMRLYIVGGGGCLIKNFGVYDKNRVTVNDDICATAKGYEYLARLKLERSGELV